MSIGADHVKPRFAFCKFKSQRVIRFRKLLQELRALARSVDRDQLHLFGNISTPHRVVTRAPVALASRNSQVREREQNRFCNCIVTGGFNSKYKKSPAATCAPLPPPLPPPLSACAQCPYGETSAAHSPPGQQHRRRSAELYYTPQPIAAKCAPSDAAFAQGRQAAPDHLSSPLGSRPVTDSTPAARWYASPPACSCSGYARTSLLHPSTARSS